MKHVLNVYTGISQLVQPHASSVHTREPLTVVHNAALAIQNKQVIAAGSYDSVMKQIETCSYVQHVLDRAVVMPGFVDSHTHLIFAHHRIDDFARRVRGESYAQIAQAGGGIASSALHLAQASEDALYERAMRFLEYFFSKGVTVCEIKTGYGLYYEQELKQLRVLQRLSDNAPVHIVGTLLAHVIPKSYAHQRAAFIQDFITQLIEPIQQFSCVQFLDIFVEQGAYSHDEARVFAQAAFKSNLRLKLHGDQLQDGHTAALGAELGAISVDHLEHTSLQGAQALAQSNTMATILPGCSLFLGVPMPNGRLLRDAGCNVAIATDCNPGSSMVFDLPLCATLAATQCGLTLEEALWGITRGGALALGLTQHGLLTPGSYADAVAWHIEDYRQVLYQVGYDEPKRCLKLC